jgi:hypothetical protein
MGSWLRPTAGFGHNSLTSISGPASRPPDGRISERVFAGDVSFISGYLLVFDSPLNCAFHCDPSRDDANLQTLQDCLRDNELRGVPLADSPIGVQNLGQSESGLSKNFDGLRSLHLPIILISKG